VTLASDIDHFVTSIARSRDRVTLATSEHARPVTVPPFVTAWRPAPDGVTLASDIDHFVTSIARRRDRVTLATSGHARPVTAPRSSRRRAKDRTASRRHRMSTTSSRRSPAGATV
jgi:hypothetical protein